MFSNGGVIGEKHVGVGKSVVKGMGSMGMGGDVMDVRWVFFQINIIINIFIFLKYIHKSIF